jgi:hypothetical protein
MNLAPTIIDTDLSSDRSLILQQNFSCLGGMSREPTLGQDALISLWALSIGMPGAWSQPSENHLITWLLALLIVWACHSSSSRGPRRSSRIGSCAAAIPWRLTHTFSTCPRSG